MKELIQKVADRERDAIDLMTTSASLEVSLQAASAEYMHLLLPSIHHAKTTFIA